MADSIAKMLWAGAASRKALTQARPTPEDRWRGVYSVLNLAGK